MSGEEKSVYYNEAEHLKNLHKIQHPDYKYTPKVSKQESPKPSTIISPASSTPNKQTPEDPNDLEILQVASSSSKASHIQVPKPLSMLSTSQAQSSSAQASVSKQSLLVSKTTRPTPALIPVQPQSISVASINSKSVTNQSKPNVEILNVPSRPNIRISSSFAPKRRESVEIIQSVTSTQLTSRDQIQLSTREQPQASVSLQQPVSMDDIPKNLLSIGQETSHGHVSVSSGSQIISIGGENYLLPQEPEPAQKLVLSQEQAQQLLRAQEQGQQQIIIEQPHHQQLVFNQEPQQLHIDPNQHLQIDQQLHIDPNQQLQLDPNQQHIFVDENGQQVVLTPDQQLQFLQQYNETQPLQFDQAEVSEAEMANLEAAG